MNQDILHILIPRLCKMSKKGTKRPDYTHTQPKNDESPVPVIPGESISWERFMQIR